MSPLSTNTVLSLFVVETPPACQANMETLHRTLYGNCTLSSRQTWKLYSWCKVGTDSWVQLKFPLHLATMNWMCQEYIVQFGFIKGYNTPTKHHQVEVQQKVFYVIIFKLGENLQWMFSNTIQRLFIINTVIESCNNKTNPSFNEFGIDFCSFLVV